MQRGIKFVLTFLLSIYLLGVLLLTGGQITGFSVFEPHGSPQYQSLVMGNSIAEDIGNFFQRLFNDEHGGEEVYLSEPDVACQAKVSGGVYSDSFTDEDCIIEKNNVSISNGNVVPQIVSDAGTLVNGLVGLWHFDEMNGNLMNTVSNGHTGIVYGGTRQGILGKFGTAYKFDGVDDWVQISGSDLQFATSDFTLSFWVNYTGVGGRIVGTADTIGTNFPGYDCWLFSAGNGKIQCDIDGKNGHKIGLRSSNAYNNGRWHNVILTVNRLDSAQMFVDGSLVASNSSANLLGDINSGYNLSVGRLEAYNSQYFNGSVDEVAVWNRKLSASEVLTLNSSAVDYYVTLGNFTSKQIYLDREYNAVTATWSDSSIKLEITSDGTNWCDIASGNLLRKTTCSQLPANNFTYRAIFNGNVNLSSVNFAFENEDCWNNIDDDEDGAIDCVDSDCSGTRACKTTLINPSRTTCTAPCGVFFDGIGRLSWKDIEEHRFDWDFGAGTESDVSSGGRNFRGYMAAHVYETPGNYNVSLKMYKNNIFVEEDKVTVNVLPFMGRTICVSLAGDFIGCPSGNVGDHYTDFASAYAQKASGMRILFHRGDKYFINPNGNNSNPNFNQITFSEVNLGAYGDSSLEKPLFANATFSIDRLTMSDLHLSGQFYQMPSGYLFTGYSTAVVLRSEIGPTNCVHAGIQVSSEALIVDSTIHDLSGDDVTQICSYTESFGMFMGGDGPAAILNSRIDNTQRANIRKYKDKVLLANSFLGYPHTNPNLRFYNKWNLVTNNSFYGEGGQVIGTGQGPFDADNDPEKTDSNIIVEKNYFISMNRPGSKLFAEMPANNEVIRNNFGINPNHFVKITTIYNSSDYVMTPANNVSVYGNTVYSYGLRYFVTMDDQPRDNIRVQNNLMISQSYDNINIGNHIIDSALKSRISLFNESNNLFFFKEAPASLKMYRYNNTLFNLTEWQNFGFGHNSRVMDVSGLYGVPVYSAVLLIKSKSFNVAASISGSAGKHLTVSSLNADFVTNGIVTEDDGSLVSNLKIISAQNGPSSLDCNQNNSRDTDYSLCGSFEPFRFSPEVMVVKLGQNPKDSGYYPPVLVDGSENLVVNMTYFPSTTTRLYIPYPGNFSVGNIITLDILPDEVQTITSKGTDADGAYIDISPGLSKRPRPMVTIYKWADTIDTKVRLYPKSTSMTIDAGTPLPGLFEDFYGNLRTGTPDIGAFEYQSGTVCGNGIVEGTEVCDGNNLNGQTCQNQGFGGGTLVCAGNCLSFVTTGCTSSCTNECSTSGAKQCSGTLDYQTCGNYDADSCLEWSSAAACGTTDCDYLDTQCRNYNDVSPVCSGGTCGPGICDIFTNTIAETSCTNGFCDENGNCVPCAITFAAWSASNVIQGTQVSLSIQGTNCNGKQVNLTVWEDDSGLGDDLAVTQPSLVMFSGNNAIAAWNSEWQCDGDIGGICMLGNPEYYFTATQVGNLTNTLTSAAPELVTTRSSAICPDGIVQLPEECDDGNTYNNDSCISCKNAYCGDNLTRTGVETCDGNNLSCMINLYNGIQTCNSSCSGFNSCAATEYCGDLKKNGNEFCDGDSISCNVNGYNGIAWCNGACAGYSSCVLTESCGYGIIQSAAGEQCDDNNKIDGDGCDKLCKIEIIGTMPSLNVANPSEGNIYVNKPVPLEYTGAGSGATNCWYVLDSNAKTTTTCSVKTTISISAPVKGVVYNHNITAFANNSVGTVNVTKHFKVKSTRNVKVQYTTFAGYGQTTDLDNLTDTELQNASLILDDGLSGAISSDNVNLTAIAVNDTEDENSTIIDLDSYVNISDKKISVDNTGPEIFTGNSTLIFRNIYFKQPKILRNDFDCGSDCVINNYDTDLHILEVSVPGFSYYEVIEGYAAPSGDDGSGGGGGGGSGGGGVLPLRNQTNLTGIGSCSELWQCSSWSECANGTMTRVCEDLKVCGSEEEKPETQASCGTDFGGILENPISYSTIFVSGF